MIPERLATVVQFIGATLGIPAAAVGSYSAYHNYFSTEASCQRLSTNILAVMERNISAESRRALLRKDVTEFDKSCGESDPDARSVFLAALHESEYPAVAPSPAGAARPHLAAPAPPRPSSMEPPALGFGGERGWVTLSRRKEGSWINNFAGYGISETSLPPANVVLTAHNRLPVWSEMQGASNDQSQLQGVLAAGSCVRVLSARRGSGRLWAETVPASCNGWVLLTRREAGSLVPNFDGHAISDISLPPAGTVLVAQRQLRVWSEPQLTNANDQSKWKNVLPAGSCVRVLATRSGSERLWAEVVPASCS